MPEIKELQYWIDGGWQRSTTDKYMDCYDPSTGEVIARAPKCTSEEVEATIASAKKAYPAWSNTPPNKRVQVLFRMKALLDKHLDELTLMVAKENGKVLDEAMGDVLKVTEVVEFACGITHLMKGPALMNCSVGYDTTQYMESIGVFAGIAPWNFPAMIPMGWMAPLCIATGNTMIIKAASFCPETSMRIMELWAEAGLPPGVLNLITCSRNESEIFLRHPDVKGISFVGSTSVGRHIYEVAAANGRGIINSAFGCAGERCMALPVIVVEEEIADELVGILKEQSKNLKVGPAYDKTSQMGPVVNAEHKASIVKWIEKGIEEGAELVLDGRNIVQR